MGSSVSVYTFATRRRLRRRYEATSKAIIIASMKNWSTNTDRSSFATVTVVLEVAVVVAIAVVVMAVVEVALIVSNDIEVTVDVEVTGVDGAIHMPEKPTVEFVSGGLEYCIVNEPEAVWPLGSTVSKDVGTVQVAVTTPPAGKRFTDCPPTPLFETKPPTVPEN